MTKVQLYLFIGLVQYFILRQYIPKKEIPKLTFFTISAIGRRQRYELIYSSVRYLRINRALRITLISVFTVMLINEFQRQIFLTLLKSSPAISVLPSNGLEFRYSLKIEKILLLRAPSQKAIKASVFYKLLSKRDFI